MIGQTIKAQPLLFTNEMLQLLFQSNMQMNDYMVDQCIRFQNLQLELTQARLADFNKGLPPTFSCECSENLDLWIKNSEEHYSDKKKVRFVNDESLVNLVIRKGAS